MKVLKIPATPCGPDGDRASGPGLPRLALSYEVRERAISGVSSLGRWQSAFRLQIVARQAVLQNRERLLRRVGKTKKVQVGFRDHAVFHERVKIQNLAPVTGAVEHNQNLVFELLRLRQA